MSSSRLSIAVTATLACWFALASPRLAQADIIMFDMHLSNAEVKAAYRAAQKRGEDLIVLPQVDWEARVLRLTLPGEIARLTQKLALAEAALSKAHDSTASSARIEALENQVNAIGDELTGKQGKWAEMSALIPKSINAIKLLREVLTDLTARGRTVTALIASGESTGLGFEGNVGGVYRLDLKPVFDEFPAQRDSLQSVFLWGCYSANRDDVIWWRESFPKLKAIFGFSGKAPLGTNPVSSKLLRDALLNDSSMVELTNAKQIRKAFHSLEGVKGTQAVASINSTYVGVDFEPQSLALPPACEGAEELLRATFPAFQNCYVANSSCLSLPTNTQSSPLRKFYEHLQNYSSCRGYSTFISDLPMTHKVISLIFFSRVRTHFAKFYEKEIAEANAVLESSEFNETQLRFRIQTTRRCRAIS